MRAGALVLTLGAGLVVLGLWAVPAGGADEPENDPFPLRRVLELSPDRLSAQLERARQGVLVKLPLTEFEERVRRARQALRAAPPAPLLAEATYRASLVEAPANDVGARGHVEPYLTGRGQWKVQHRGPDPALLPLRPLSLALREPRFENREALIGDFDGEGPCLLFDRPGKQEVLFEWTTRGDQSPEGIRFDWRVPPAPVALLELELPIGRTVSVRPESCLVKDSGPAESPDRRVWTIYCSQQSVLHLTINPDPEAGPSPGAGALVVKKVESRHALAPEGESSDFTFDLEVTARGVRSLAFACDPPLVPYKVSLQPGSPVPLDRWEFRPPRKPSERGTLTLHFREAIHGLVHPRVVCRGALGRPRPIVKGKVPSTEQRDWFCPGLYVLPGVHLPRTETIEVRCHPQLRLEDWHPGDFRLTGAETETDGTYRLTLSGTGVPGGTASPLPPGVPRPETSARPSALLRTHGVDYRANVLTWWQLDGASPVLTARVTYDVRYGRLFELPLLVAPGWEVERVWCPASAERVRNWAMNPASGVLLGGKPANQLLVELHPPFEAERLGGTEGPATVSVRLRWRGGRGDRPSPTAWTASLPAVLPANAGGIEGGLAVDWDDELFDASFTTPVVPAGGKPAKDVPLTPSGKAPAEGPWGTQMPRAYFPWQGQPPQGTLRLTTRPAEVRTRVLNEVHLSPGRLTVSTRLTLDVEAGAVGGIDLCLAPPLLGSSALAWEVVEDDHAKRLPGDARSGHIQVRSFERLPVIGAAAAVSPLAASNPLAAVAFATPSLAAERWRLTLARPLGAQQSVTLRATRHLRWPPGAEGAAPAPQDEQALWSVPLITPARTGRGEGEVRVYAEQGELPADALVAFGLRERAGPQGTETSAGGPRLWRVYTQTSPAVGLSLRGRPLALVGPTGWPRAGPRPESVIPRATLLTRAESDGRLLHQLAFEARGWTQPILPLVLSQGARLASARVDGQDVTNLPLLRETEDGLEVALPVPASSSARGEAVLPASHFFEVVYVTERAPWHLWARLEAPEPKLPLRPLALRRVWRLPASWAPVVQTGLTRLPGPEPPGLLAALPLGRSLLSLPSLLTPDRWAARQEQAVRAADARLRRDAAGRRYTLAEALHDLAFAGLAAQDEGLVVDAVALEEAGLHPGTTFRVGGETPEAVLASLEPLGLVYVPCRAAPLVTTRRQWQVWKQAVPGLSGSEAEGRAPEDFVPASVATAVAAALSDGHDLSGRFCTTLDWLRRNADGALRGAGLQPASSRRQVANLPHEERPFRGPRSAFIVPDGSGPWVDWEVAAGAKGEESLLWVVRAEAPSGGGLVLAGLLLVWAWGARPARHGWRGVAADTAAAERAARRRALGRLLLWIAAAGLAYVWLPAGLRDLAWWPLAAVCAVALWWYLTPYSRRRGRDTSRSSNQGSPRGEVSPPPPGDDPGGPPAGGEAPLAAVAGQNKGDGPPGAATAGVLALLLATWALGPAAPPVTTVAADLPRAPARQEETTVYLLPGVDGKAPASVLVPPALLERLDRRPAAPSLPGAVLISADYQGTVKKLGDRIARFEADFRVYCPGPGPATLELPLDGKNLVTEPAVLFDGADASLTALPPPRPGYALKIAGQGLHKVRVVFRAEVVGPTDDRSGGGLRELQFGIPRVAQSRLLLRLPKGSAFPQALVKLGAQRVTEDNTGLLLEADVGAPLSADRSTAPGRAATGGAAIPVHLRWRQPQPGERPRVRFKEAYLWDLGQRGHTLTGILVYTIDQGAVSRLIVDVPPELLVGRVEARRPAPPGPVTPGAVDEAAVRLRDWHLEAGPPPPSGGGRPGPRPLHLDFQAPVSGEVAVLLALHPRDGLFKAPGMRPGPAAVTLPVPHPHGTPLPQEGYLAYRLQGLEARRIDNLRVEGVNPDAFPAFFWQTAGRAGTPAYTCRILREGTEGPKLTLAVRSAPARRDGKLNVHWRIGSGAPGTAGRADFRAALDLSAPDGDLTLVEWEVPAGVEVAAVTGEAVREWSLNRPGAGTGRLQVWLRRAADRAHLDVFGSTPLARLPVPERKWLPAGPALSLAMQETLTRSGLFVLPALRVIGMERTPPVTQIELSAGDGMDLVALSPLGKDEEGLFLPRSSFTLRPATFQYGGARFAVVPARPPSVRLVTTLEVTERQLTFQTRAEVVSSGTSLRALRLRVDNWRGPAPDLESPGARQRSEEHGKGARAWRSWSVEWADAGAGAKILTLSGRMPLEEALTADGDLPGDGLPVPVVRVSGAVSVESWLVLGKGASRFRPSVLTAGESSATPRPLQPEPLPAGTGRPEEGWRLDTSSGPARQTVLLVREEAPGDAPPVRVVLREQTSAAPDGRRWLHETTWWLYHSAPTDLVFTLPDGVAILGVSVDGRDHPFRQGDQETKVDRSLRERDAAHGVSGLQSPGLLVSLSGEGARKVSLRWEHRDGSEELARPGLRGPRLQGEGECPAAWTLHVPAGLHTPPGAFRAGPLAAARLELRCAETHLRLTQLLLESTARLPARKGTRTLEAQLSDCQRRFALCCRNADQLLRTVPQPESTARERSGERAVETEAGHPHERVAELQERLESLRRENRRLTEANGMGALRRDAERLARRSGATDEGRPGGPAGTAPWDVESLAVSGRPFYRLSGDATPGPVAATAPLLVTSAGLEWRRAVGATALLACGLLAVWLLSAFPSFVALTQVFWPEQVVLLGLFGLQTVGATWPVVFLLVLGGSARVLAVVGGLLRSVQRSRPQQPHPA